MQLPAASPWVSRSHGKGNRGSHSLMRGEAAGCTWLLAARDGWGTNPITTWLDVMLVCSKLLNILASQGKASSACLWLQALVIPRSALSGVLWDSAFQPWGLIG